LRDKYFQATNGRYVFNNLLRRGVIFGRHDLVQDAPISRLDLLVCRNTIMYLNAETQGRVLARLHFALSDEGFIFLGRAEMLLTHTDLFTPLNSRHRIFVKVPRANLRDRLLVLAEAGNQEARNHLARYVTLRELALEASPLAQIVVDRGGNLTLANEAARTLLGIDPKDLGRSFRDLEARYRPVAFREYIQQAEADRGPVTVGNVEHALPDGAMKYLDVRITPLVDNGGDARGFSITFLDVTRTTELQSDLHRSSQDLETAYEELQSTNEELETSNEELQSTVEELETTNEELQSSNEELETMNEELQSTNEELQAINEQLRGRTEELRRAKSFLESVLSSLSLGVVVVDGHLAIREWNHKAEDLWGLRSDEVEGQSLLHLDIGLPVEKLKEPMRACLDGAGERQEIVLEATNRRGQALRCRISFSPLLGLDSKKREGVILLMDEKGRSLPGRKSSG
ncbi:MAG: PAS domain S-box protein, partial [Actinomycetota bacterium]